MQAVVLDLFGTLIAAPTPEERASAASRVAAVAGCDTTRVESYFRDTWHVRHVGTLPTLADLAAHLVRVVHGPGAAVRPVADELRTLGRARLRGALAAGMAAVAVRRRGPTNALAFSDTDWSGPVLDTAEHVPAYLAQRA